MKGDECQYDHQLSKYPCNNYLTKGSCNRGAACKFSHEKVLILNLYYILLKFIVIVIFIQTLPQIKSPLFLFGMSQIMSSVSFLCQGTYVLSLIGTQYKSSESPPPNTFVVWVICNHLKVHFF